jgi:hypothetical protein
VTFLIFLIFRTLQSWVRDQELKSPGGTAGSCLIQNHVSASSLRRPGGTFKGRTLTQALRPITANLFKMFFFKPPTRPSSWAKRLVDLWPNRGSIARSRRTSTVAVLLMLFEAFLTTKPENRLFRRYAPLDGHGYIFSLHSNHRPRERPWQVPQVPASVVKKLQAAWGE